MSTADMSDWLPGLYHRLPAHDPDSDEDAAYAVGALSDATSHVELSDESGQNSHPDSDEGDGHAADEATSLDHAVPHERYLRPSMVKLKTRLANIAQRPTGSLPTGN